MQKIYRHKQFRAENLKYECNYQNNQFLLVISSYPIRTEKKLQSRVGTHRPIFIEFFKRSTEKEKKVRRRHFRR